MSKGQNSIVPQLRFPEFESYGDWNIDKFSSFIKLYRGSSPRPISQFLTKDENGVNWIKIGDTKNAVGFEISKVEEKITTEGSKKSRKVKKGELILANSMSYGATYELKIEGCIYDGWFVLREYEDSFDKQFLLQLLNSDFLQIQYKRLAAGGIVQNISSEIVYNTLLPKFSIKEQQKIAACLSSLDEVINAETEKLELLQDHKKGLLQQLFPQEGETQPKYRFPEFINDGDWEKRTLGDEDFTIIIMGSSPKSSSYNENKKGLPLLQGNADIKNRKSKPRIYTTEVTKKCEIDDILLSVRAPVGTVAKSLHNACIGRGISAIRVVKGNSQEFLYQWLISFEPYWVNISQGGTFDSVNSSDIKSLKIFLPKNPKEQQKIADCLSAADDLIEAQSQKIEDLQFHKKGLLQQLFPNVNEVAV
ncbi:restriction endonuclease subunit S [Corallibacter vietnamensis]